VHAPIQIFDKTKPPAFAGRFFVSQIYLFTAAEAA
jgi:hypothetical protein